MGATSAIAAEVAQIYAGRGARLHLVGRNPTKLREVAARLAVADASHEIADFSDLARNEGVIERALQILGGIDAVREIWWRLMDAVDPSLVAKLERAAEKVDGVQAINALRVRWIGHTLHAEGNVEVDGSLSTREAHAIAEGVRHAMLHAAPWLRSATVHVDPCRHDGQDHHAVTSHHFPDRRASRQSDEHHVTTT